jgi:hypothetical protein
MNTPLSGKSQRVTNANGNLTAVIDLDAWGGEM